MKKTSHILVSGSLVFDTIFELGSSIKDQVRIENGIASKQNLMFTAREKEIYFGGTAGNICFGLGLLNQSSFALSVVGKDFADYSAWLKNNKAEFRGKLDKDGYTATFFGMTDTNKDQLGIFQGGSYNKHIGSLSLSSNFSNTELAQIKCAIFSPGTAKSITKQISEFSKINSNAFVIFDPGQMLAIDFTEESLIKSLKNSDILIVNDSEFSYLKNSFGINLEKIFSLGVSYIIETKGTEGSILYEMIDGEISETKIKTPKVKKVVDPTGAGDAYRAGIIYGIVNDLDIKESMILASKLGAECVKQRGGQTYKI
ncbi:MAG: sugar kinase ribokinase family protein [Candidatus Taylorbacteria bacterium]|nr:sugar kinase ribokinase family protein [Candidatus Taylorbacteria bacterium]